MRRNTLSRNTSPRFRPTILSLEQRSLPGDMLLTGLTGLASRGLFDKDLKALDSSTRLGFDELETNSPSHALLESAELGREETLPVAEEAAPLASGDLAGSQTYLDAVVGGSSGSLVPAAAPMVEVMNSQLVIGPARGDLPTVAEGAIMTDAVGKDLPSGTPVDMEPEPYGGGGGTAGVCIPGTSRTYVPRDRVQYVGIVNRAMSGASVTGRGPMTLNLNITLSVSNQWGATVGVGSGTVSAGVQFQVTASRSYTYSATVNVPTGQTWRLQAYNQYYRYSFEVWKDPCPGSAHRIGTGWADRFFGVYYDHWRV